MTLRENMLIRFVIICLLCFLAMKGVAQKVISGKVIDITGRPIENVSISYKTVKGTAILGYAKSNDRGEFKLSIKSTDLDSLRLDFNHLAYVRKSDVVANKTASYTYTLEEGVRQLKEVHISEVPVFKRNDTIHYNVSAFASKQDRFIGDIIKKLPGIEMNGDQIFYQGKPIQKYMVNNLDLMEGRYNMINNNLPADVVKKVQVIENNQPIKILDSLVFSDRTSLNLELKKFTSTGTGEAAIGVKPALWKVNLTPMTFGKTFQMLNSFQINNVGDDVAKQLRPFYTGGNYFGNNATINDGPSYISLRNMSSPGFDEKKWLDNRILMFSTNVLQKLDNGLELKGNVSYYDDTQHRKGFTSTQYFTSDQVILNSELVDNRYRLNVLDLGVLVEKNEKQIYLRNNLKYHKKWNSDFGNLLFNEQDPVAQQRMYTDEAFLNSLSMARFMGKQLVNIRSTVEYHSTPQRLTVQPGQFEDILNGGYPYEQLAQQVLYRSMRWDNGLSFIRKVENWRISPIIGLNYDRNALESSVKMQKDGVEQQFGQDYVNDMLNSQLELSMRMDLNWENKKWKFSLRLPYSMHYFNVEQQGVKTMENTLKSTYKPATYLTYLMNSKSEISMNVVAGRQFGGLNNFYNGYIIEHYRSMQRYNARLLLSESVNASLNYNYKNTVKASFANLGYSYLRGSRDYVFQAELDAQGRSTTSVANRWGRNFSHSLSGGVSRFFSDIKTVIKLNGNTRWSQSDYLLNNVMSKQNVYNTAGKLEIVNNLSSALSADYKTDIGVTQSKLAGGLTNSVFYNNHYFNLNLYYKDRHTLMFNYSYYRNNIKKQRDQYFLDATYRYRLKKWRTDIELSAQNLLNNNEYIQQFSSDYQLVQTYYELRPRQFLVSSKFRF